MWSSTPKRKYESNSLEKQEGVETLVYLWQKVCEKEVKLNRMYSLFGHDPSGKVYKNKFWLAAERLGAKLTSEEVQSTFNFFDRDRKGFFTFSDFVRVSKQVQGYEIDQVISQGIFKRGSTKAGKKCRGFSEHQAQEYSS